MRRSNIVTATKVVDSIWRIGYTQKTENIKHVQLANETNINTKQREQAINKSEKLNLTMVKCKMIRSKRSEKKDKEYMR